MSPLYVAVGAPTDDNKAVNCFANSFFGADNFAKTKIINSSCSRRLYQPFVSGPKKPAVVNQ